MAKKAKKLEIDEKHIYKPEIEHCPHCGERLEKQGHYQWRKVVQRIDGSSVRVSDQGSECRNPGCEYKGKVYTSAKAQRVTLPGCTYEMEIIAQIGWWRQREHRDRLQMHGQLRARGVQISERQVDYLYERYEVLLNCVEQSKVSELEQIVEEYGGLVIDLDGLAPEGANEQLWVVREVLSGIVLVAAWLPKVDHKALIKVLEPVEDMGLPILGTVSDKQPCVKKALEIIWSDVPHQWCQAHYLGNVMEPVYDQDCALKTSMRKEIRQAIRPIVNEVFQESHSPDTEPQLVSGALVQDLLPEDAEASSPQHGQVVKDLVLDLKQVLLRKGRSPFVLAGLPMLDDLLAFQATLSKCLHLAEDQHLRGLHDALEDILPRYAQSFAKVQTAQTWVETLSTILDKPLPTKEVPGPGGDAVALEVAHFFGSLAQKSALPIWLEDFRTQLFNTSDHYWSGLFHCYDVIGLPRTNNDLEALFGQIKRQFRRRLGVYQLREHLLRHGAWAILQPNFPSPTELAHHFANIPWPQYFLERARYDLRQAGFLRRYRWRSQRDQVLHQRLADWTNAVSRR